MASASASAAGAAAAAAASRKPSRVFALFNLTATVGAAAFFALRGDFGRERHVFSDLRASANRWSQRVFGVNVARVDAAPASE